jgi:hypothetical protein
MLENLKQLVKENAQNAIVDNGEIPNEQNDAAIDAASGSIFDTLKQQLTSGNLNSLADVFKGGNVQDSAVVREASSSFIDKLGSMGINLDSAKGIAASLIPGIMDKFVNKTNDPNDNSFDLGDILSKVSGPDGKFQLSDLTDLMGGQNDNQTGTQTNQGGIMDKLKGFFQ